MNLYLYRSAVDVKKETRINLVMRGDIKGLAPRGLYNLLNARLGISIAGLRRPFGNDVVTAKRLKTRPVEVAVEVFVKWKRLRLDKL